MQNVTMGGNAPLTASRLEIIVEWPASAGTLESSAYLVGSSGRVRSDDDMVFYNQLSDADGCVKIVGIEADRTVMAVDLTRVPSDVERIVVCVTVEGAVSTMSAFSGTAATVMADGRPMLTFRPDLTAASEVAMRLVALYRRNGAWKFRADGQGFNSGLAQLARSFGIDVDEGDPAPPAVHQIVQPVPMPAAKPAVVPSATPEPIGSFADLVSEAPRPLRRDDGSTRLSAATPSAHWRGSTPAEFGEISVRLDWDSQCGGLEGRPRPLEVGLGCHYELQDGRNGVVQSWDGNGQFDTAPFIHLAHGETGGTRGDQKIRVNGGEWSAIRKLTMFAYIMSGAPSWHTASVSLAVATSGEAPVSISFEGGPDGNSIVALLTMHNRNGEIDFARVMRFATGHQELDAELGWGLRWQTRYN
ncbi:TerD family protein [Sphingomonas sp. R86521]|uniref:TerD family protein n=1 Tax=Sphingomonas sp. R86521 TaxID=3093860 RepID=UPI0036D211E6